MLANFFSVLLRRYSKPKIEKNQRMNFHKNETIIGSECVSDNIKRWHDGSMNKLSTLYNKSKLLEEMLERKMVSSKSGNEMKDTLYFSHFRDSEKYNRNNLHLASHCSMNQLKINEKEKEKQNNEIKNEKTYYLLNEPTFSNKLKSKIFEIGRISGPYYLSR